VNAQNSFVNDGASSITVSGPGDTIARHANAFPPSGRDDGEDLARYAGSGASAGADVSASTGVTNTARR